MTPMNSMAPGGLEWNFSFKLILVIIGWGISCEIVLRWMSLDLTDDKSTLVQVMAGTKPLPEPMLTQIYVALLCHQAWMR